MPLLGTKLAERRRTASRHRDRGKRCAWRSTTTRNTRSSNWGKERIEELGAKAEVIGDALDELARSSPKGRALTRSSGAPEGVAMEDAESEDLIDLIDTFDGVGELRCFLGGFVRRHDHGFLRRLSGGRFGAFGSRRGRFLAWFFGGAGDQILHRAERSTSSWAQ